MTKRRIVIFVLCVSILIPFAINFIGWNLYAYVNFGDRDLVLASALGVSHNASAKHREVDAENGPELADEVLTTFVDSGFLTLFAERRGDPMTPFTFSIIKSDEFSDYSGFEFPWLLLLVVPVILAIKAKRHRSGDF